MMGDACAVVICLRPGSPTTQPALLAALWLRVTGHHMWFVQYVRSQVEVVGSNPCSNITVRLSSAVKERRFRLSFVERLGGKQPTHKSLLQLVMIC